MAFLSLVITSKKVIQISFLVLLHAYKTEEYALKIER